MQYGKKLLHLWQLDKSVTFLNHGSFGATPKIILAEKYNWSLKMETQPVEFYLDKYPILLRESIETLASFVGADPKDMTFVENATTGVNTVIRSLLPDFLKGGEITITNHTYPAVKNTAKYMSSVTGAKINEIEIPIPIESDEQILEQMDKQLSDKTKLAIFDHVSSPTGIVFPIKKIVELCRKKGIKVMVDGAHAPGMVDLNINDIAADWYTGNCHKWLFAPKGSAFLWTSPENQSQTHPLNISLEFEQGYEKEFDWTGTKNPTAWLSVPAGIKFFYEYGGDEIKDYNHNLVTEAGEMLCDSSEFTAVSPKENIGSIFSFMKEKNVDQKYCSSIRKKLLDEFKIEVPIFAFGNKLIIRISAQIYNQLSDYQRLSEAIKIINL